MKNLYKILGICTMVASIATSCEAFDDQLTDEPKNQYSEIQVFSTEEGVETAVNGMYSEFQAFDYNGARMRLLLCGHSGKYNSKQGANADANRLAVTNANVNLDKLWRGMWQTVNQTNIVILNVEGTGLQNEDSSLGQAYFLRAVTYFDLVRLFEEVPIRTAPTTKDDIHIAKSSKEEVYNLVISDLLKAKELLPDVGEYKNGRPLKYAANAFLAKVYITLAGSNDAALQPAGFDPVTESEITATTLADFWEEAKDELDVVINEGPYSLPSTYAEVFEEGARNTSEAIFELQYGHTGAARTNDVTREFIPKNHPSIPVGTVGFGRNRPNKVMFSDHIIQYSGLTFSDNYIPFGNNEAIELDPAIADPRINSTYIYNSYNWSTNDKLIKVFPLKNKGNDAYAFINKYADGTYNGTTTTNNSIILRYAEVLLLRAEVENEINGPATAYTYVNQVLSRARTTEAGTTVEPADWNATSVADQDTFRERIMKEREYELNGEGHEWFDMRRRGLDRFQEQIDWHNASIDFYGSNNNKDFKFENIETEMKLPIPLAEINANNLISE